jgi:hypothetical protein
MKVCALYQTRLRDRYGCSHLLVDHPYILPVRRALCKIPGSTLSMKRWSDTVGLVGSRVPDGGVVIAQVDVNGETVVAAHE